MEAYLVTVFFLWMLPLGLNAAVTFPPNQHSTNFRSSELTTPSDKNTDGLKVTKESLTNASNVGHQSTVDELQHTKKSEQNPDQVSTKHTVSSSSMHPQNIRTKRKAEEKQDRQATTKKDNSTMDMTTKTEETASTLGIQPVDRSATHTRKSQLRSTAPSLPVISELSTKTTASPKKTQAPNQTAKIQTGPALATPLTLQSNSSTDITQNTQIGVGSEVTVTADESPSSTSGGTQPSSTPTQYPVTTRRSTSLRPTDQVPTDRSEMPHYATPTATTLPPTTALTNPTVHITSQASSEPAKTITTAAAKVTASTAVIITRGQSTPTAPITEQTVAFTTAGKTAEPLPPSDTANKETRKKRGNEGTVVAVLIGGALVLMMVGFAVILVRKQRQRKMQLQNTSWAGPSPFMDGGFQSHLDNDHSSAVHLRGSNRVSFSGFLSQRLSKRMSLLQETDDQIHLDDIPVGLTFGRESASDDVNPSNGTAAVDKVKTQTEETRPPGSSSSPPLSISSGTNATEPTKEQPPYSSSSPPTSASSGTTATAHADEQQPSAPLQVVDLKPDNAHHPSPPPPDSPKTVPLLFLDVDLPPPLRADQPPSTREHRSSFPT